MNLKLSTEGEGIRDPSPVAAHSTWSASLEGLASSISACTRMASSSSSSSSSGSPVSSPSTSPSQPTTQTLPSALPLSVSSHPSLPVSRSMPQMASFVTSRAPAASSSASASAMAERRRSVEFNLDETIPKMTSSFSLYNFSASSSQNPKNDIRCRSLSSTWETSDSEGDDEELDDDDLAVQPLDLDGHTSTSTSTRSSRSATRRTRPHLHKRRSSRQRVNERLRIRRPASSQIAFGGWTRGQPADVEWEVVDPSVRFVRIDLCNLAWKVPTTIAHRVPNNGSFRWRRVYWGLPIRGGYYLRVYDVTNVPEPATPPRGLQVLSNVPSPDAVELTTSEYFSMLG